VAPDVLNNLDEASNFFQLRVVVQVDNLRITLYSLLMRDPRGPVTPILRSLGTV